MSFLFGTFANVPDTVNAGCIMGHFVNFQADEDGDQRPDEVPVGGTVNITPTVQFMRWSATEPPRLAVMASISCPVIEGDIYPPGTTAEDVTNKLVDPGVWVVATDQPSAQPTTVQYSVSFRFTGTRAQPPNVTVTVPTDSVVDLVDILPSSPEPGTVTVVSSADRELAEQAAAEAINARDDAETAATAAKASETKAATEAAKLLGTVRVTGSTAATITIEWEE